VSPSHVPTSLNVSPPQVGGLTIASCVVTREYTYASTCMLALLVYVPYSSLTRENFHKVVKSQVLVEKLLCVSRIPV